MGAAPSSGASYRLIRTLAVGGMAQVLEAVREEPGGEERRVALKRILPERAGDEAMQRMFLEEARVAAGLEHPNIARVLDFGAIDGAAFLASELIEGLDVGRAIERAGPIPEPIASAIAARVARALAHVAARGVVHRDVSPQNILLSWDGRVALADFGIALSAGRDWQTTAGVIKGKRVYMAPEQARGEAVGPPADVYALALTFQAMLFGDLGELESGPAARAEMPAIVGRALAPGAGDRPSAQALAEALDAGESASTRAAIAAWMETLREARPAASALDDLMGLCIVPTGIESDEVRRFTAHRAAPAADRVREPARPGRGWVGAALVASAIAAAVGLVGAAAIGADGDVERGPAAEATPEDDAHAEARRAEGDARADHDAPAGTGAEAGETRAASEVAPSEAAPSEAAPSEAAPSEAAPSEALAASRPAEPEPRALAAGDAPVAAAPELGWVRVGGRAFLRAEVLVDGVSIGHAPLERAVPIGRRAIEVRREGQSLATYDVEVRRAHTRAGALRLTR